MKILEFKIVNQGDTFTVLGIGEDNKIYFWKEGKWNEL